MPIPDPRAVRLLPGLVVLPMLARPSPSWTHFLTTHGVTIDDGRALVPVAVGESTRVRIGRYGSAMVAYIKSTCRQLAEDGTCRLYGQPERPAACVAYPSMVADLQEVKDVCTYHFEDEP